jgi:hypothetical protein
MNEAQQVLEQAKQVAETLETQGPREVGSFKMTLFQKQMRKFNPQAKRRKNTALRQGHKRASKTQRREFTKSQERKAHRRFEVATGRRANTKPLADVAAMITKKEGE